MGYCYLGVMSGLIKCNIFTFIFLTIFIIFKSYNYEKKIPMTLWILCRPWYLTVFSGFIKLTHWKIKLTQIFFFVCNPAPHGDSIDFSATLLWCRIAHPLKGVRVRLQWVNFIKPDFTPTHQVSLKIHSVIGIFL